MHQITIYTSNTCPHCQSAKDYMTTRGFKFEERNVENKDFRKELINMGYRGVPIIVIDEVEIVGFDKEKINQILSI